MAEAVCVAVLKYDELSEAAKEKAREWWTNDGPPGEWWESVYDDFDQIAAILGIEVKDKEFSGFWSQGDGACFTGTYRHVPGNLKALREYAPTDRELHRIAKELNRLQKPFFYGLEATLTKSSYHYSHAYTVDIDVEDMRDNAPAGRGVPRETQEAMAAALRGLMQWLYKALESEYEHEVSDENVAEILQINEYDFFPDGSRAYFRPEFIVKREAGTSPQPCEG